MQKQIKGCLECLYLMIIFGICLIPLLAMSVKASDAGGNTTTIWSGGDKLELYSGAGQIL